MSHLDWTLILDLRLTTDHPTIKNIIGVDSRLARSHMDAQDQLKSSTPTEAIDLMSKNGRDTTAHRPASA